MNTTASWVIKNKITGEVILETFNPKIVTHLNTDKYEAVPIQTYLGDLNTKCRCDYDESGLIGLQCRACEQHYEGV